MNGDLNSQVLMRDYSKFKIRIGTDPGIILLLLAFCEKNIVRYFVLLVSMIPVVGVLSSFIIPTAYIVLFLMYFAKHGVHVSLKEACVVLFVVLAIVFSCLVYPENAKFILDSNTFWNTIFPCLRYYIIGLILIPDKSVLDIIGKASCLAILVETLFVIVYMMPRGLMQSDDMSRAYQILLNVLFALNYAFDKKRIAPWFCGCVGIVYCLSMGTRGPIFIILFYLFFRLIQSFSLKLRDKIILVAVIVGIMYLFFISNLYLSVLQIFQTQLSRFGFSTRVIDLAINGNITSHLSGRDILYEIVLNKIKERPLLGYGVYGEWSWIGWNSHNMYLEILAHYGVVLGSLMLLWLITLTLKAYIKTDNRISREVILILTCFVFIRGIVGGSYLNFGVFLMIGFCLREVRRL